MDFGNERYVRLYVRDTVTWKRLGWDGQNALTQLLRKADRSGVIDLGGIEPWETLVVLCGAPEDVARRGTARCLELACIVHDGDRLVFPRYLEAQEATQSGAQRVREHRARERELRAQLKQNVTVVSNETLPNANAVKRGETTGNSVPYRAVPYRAEEESAREATPTSQHQLRIGFTQRLETEASTHPNQKALGQAIQQLVPWVEKTAPLRKLSEAELITRLLNGFFANENARTKGFPPAFLAQNPTEYLDTKPQLRAAARVPDGIPPIKHYGPREETG